MKDKITINCICGKTYTKKDSYDITRHENSKVHKEFLLTNKTRKQIEDEARQNKLKEKEEKRLGRKERVSQYYKDRNRKKRQEYLAKQKELIEIYHNNLSA